MKDTTDIPRTTPDSVEGRPDALASVEGWAESVVRKKSGVRSPGASWASVEGVISPWGRRGLKRIAPITFRFTPDTPAN